MARPGLGRGLDALIPRTAAAAVSEIALDDILPNPWQPRRDAENRAIDELAQSVREHGILQPLLVSSRPDGQYQLIAGERRWWAAKRAGLQRVPVVVREVTPEQALALALVENIQRADLNPLEEASAYRRLVDEFGLTQEQLAARVGKNRVTITNALRLLSLPLEVREALAEGSISEGHARAMLQVQDAPGQLLLLRLTIERQLSVRQTEEMARRLAADLAGQGRRPRRSKSAETVAIESRIMQSLGTKVELFHSRRGGRVVIHFYSDEELESLYGRLTGEEL